MKLRILSVGIAAIFALTFSSCSNSEADEKAAVENLKKEAEGLDVWMEQKKQELASNPMGGLGLLKELSTKLKNIQSEDLPADLKAAWTDFVSKISRMEGVLAEMGSDPTEMMKKLISDPAAAQAFTQKMKALEAEIKPAAAKLSEVGKKYGLEKLGNVAPQ